MPIGNKPPAPDDDLAPNHDGEALLRAGERIMDALGKADPPIDLQDPHTLLALQWLGPLISKAMGEDPVSLRAAMNNLMEMTDLVDVTVLQALLQSKGVRK